MNARTVTDTYMIHAFFLPRSKLYMRLWNKLPIVFRNLVAAFITLSLLINLLTFLGMIDAQTVFCCGLGSMMIALATTKTYS